MSSNAKLIHIGPGEGDAFSAAGDVYRVLASGEQTGGVYTLSEIRVSPNNGPPPHVHSHEDEAFFVLEGEAVFQIGEPEDHCQNRHFHSGTTWHPPLLQKQHRLDRPDVGVCHAIRIREFC